MPNQTPIKTRYLNDRQALDSLGEAHYQQIDTYIKHTLELSLRIVLFIIPPIIVLALVLMATDTLSWFYVITGLVLALLLPLLNYLKNERNYKKLRLLNVDANKSGNVFVVKTKKSKGYLIISNESIEYKTTTEHALFPATEITQIYCTQPGEFGLAGFYCVQLQNGTVFTCLLSDDTDESTRPEMPTKYNNAIANFNISVGQRMLEALQLHSYVAKLYTLNIDTSHYNKANYILAAIIVGMAFVASIAYFFIGGQS